MRPELQSVLDSVRSMAPEQLPELLGELETIRGHCLLKLSRPEEHNGVRPQDKHLDVKKAAEKMGVSVAYLYRHHSKFSFVAREGRKLLFSSLGIDQHMARKR